MVSHSRDEIKARLYIWTRMWTHMRLAILVDSMVIESYSFEDLRPANLRYGLLLIRLGHKLDTVSLSTSPYFILLHCVPFSPRPIPFPFQTNNCLHSTFTRVHFCKSYRSNKFKRTTNRLNEFPNVNSVVWVSRRFKMA